MKLVVLQSSLAFVSRFAVFFMLPLIGFADARFCKYRKRYWNICVCNHLVPTFCVYFEKNPLKFIWMIESLTKSGSLIRSLGFVGETHELRVKLRRKIVQPLKNFYIMFFMVYLPYYVAWPLIILLMNYFPDYRATILGCASFLTGINTIAIALFIDPFFLKLVKYKRTLPVVYISLVAINFRINGCSSNFCLSRFVVAASHLPILLTICWFISCCIWRFPFCYTTKRLAVYYGFLCMDNYSLYYMCIR